MPRFREILAAILMCLAPATALAHPHEWIDVAAEILFDPQGRITAIRHHWRFDEGFTAFALQGLDTDGDGLYSADELKPLAQENVDGVKDYDYFTVVSVGDYQAGFAPPTDYELELDGDRLTLHYTLPLAQPLMTKSSVLVQVYDPEYFIAFTLPGKDAVRLVDAPAACRLTVTPAAGPDAAAAAQLATVGADQRALPDAMQSLTGGIDNSAEVNCGGPVAAGSAGPGTAGDAARMMAQGTIGKRPGSPPGAAIDVTAGDLRALPAATPPPVARDGVRARIAALQGRFNRDLTDTMKRMKSDGSAFWWLGGVSFLYGIVHAAGPGHGKVVISSYLVANEVRLRRGISLAFVSALLQAVVAVGIVGAMAALLNMTSMAMTDAAKSLETASFALVALLGLYLLVTKLRQAWAVRDGGDPHAGHSHGHGHAHHDDHQHGPACGCGHHADPALLARPGWGSAAAAVLSVGVRPCSGALVVLVFALAQGIFWAGIASTFLMALGTAITVAALACLAVGAKDLARRLTRGDGRRAAQAMLALEIGAALFIAVVGATLFAAALDGDGLTG